MNVSILRVDCEADTLSFYPDDHSFCGQLPFFGSSVTLWQIFTISLPTEYECNTTTDSCGLNLSSHWDRSASSVALTEHSQSLTCTIQSTESGCTAAVNASLTLKSVQGNPDTDGYTVSLTLLDCPDHTPVEAGRFAVDVLDPKCVTDIPEPTVTHLNYTFFESAQCPLMNVTFVGGKEDNIFSFEWYNAEGERICFTSGATRRINNSRYVCGWTTDNKATCNSTIWLSITNCSASDAGNFSVFGGKGNVTGSTAHVLLCKLCCVIIIAPQ